MRSIAIMNQKGGVGKTTTAVNVAAALARLGKRVCLVDMDPQAHATLHLGVESSPEGPSVYDLITGRAAVVDVRRQVGENLWLVASHVDLATAEVELSQTMGRQMSCHDESGRDRPQLDHLFTILRDKLGEDPEPPDFLLVDCPPSLGLLTLNALVAVREVFIPLQPHFFALHGLSKLLETIQLVGQRLNNGLRLSGVVLCMHEAGTRLAGEVAADVEEFFRQGRAHETPWAGARLYQARIRRNIRLAEAPGFGQSILDYAPTSHGAEDYERLAREILSPGPADDDPPPREPADSAAAGSGL